MKCHNCKKEILKRIDPNKLKRNKYHYCSMICFRSYWKEWASKNFSGENNPRWNNNNGRICLICSKEFRMSIQHGRTPKYCSIKCSSIGKRGTTKGNKNGMWKGGISGESDSIRHSLEYVSWRNAVGTRDKIKCQFCGAYKKLVVHHIKSFKNFPKLRFEVNNGITLCRACHMKLHAENKGIQDFTNILNDYMPNVS